MLEKHTNAAAALLLLAVSLAFSTAGFHSTWGDDETATQFNYLDSDVSITPAFTSASQTTICAGAPVSFTLDANSAWNTVSLEGGTSNGATGADQLLSPPSATHNYAIKWVTQQQSDAFYNSQASPSSMPRYFIWSQSNLPNTLNWTSFLSTVGISTFPEYDVGVKYMAPTTPFSWFGGGQNYLAYSALFCNAVANISVPGNPAFLQGYSGSAITSPQYTLPLGTHTINASIKIARCMPTIKNTRTGAGSTKTIRIMADDSFQPSFSATPISIIVKNPFACQLSSSVNNPLIYAQQSEVIGFSFTLGNNGNLGITIPSRSNITLATGSVFSNLNITNTGFPITIPSGQTLVITGTAQAPATAGTYPLNLMVSTLTSTADCDGQMKLCTNSSLHIVNVAVTPPPPQPVLCSLSFVPPADSAFLPGESATVRANCSQGGSSANCPALSWSQDAIGGSLSITNTPNATNPGTTLSINASAPYPQSGRSVNATNGSVNCTLPFSFSVVSPNTTIDCGFANHSGIFFPGESAAVQADCTIGGVPNSICPPLNWTTSISGATMAPPQTPQGDSPRSSNFTTTASTPAPQAGSVAVTCASIAQCNATCNVNMSIFPYPTNLTCSLLNGHSSTFAPNDSAVVRGVCSLNTYGRPTVCPPLHWEDTISRGYLNPEDTLATLYPNTTFTTINAPVPQTGSITANSTLAGFPPLSCAIGVGVDNLGVDYIVDKIRIPRIIPQGVEFHFDVIVKNIGNLNATNKTTTEISGICNDESGLERLLAGASGVNSFPCTCVPGVLNSITARANSRPEQQQESVYSNNNMTISFFCGSSYAPVCADYV